MKTLDDGILESDSGAPVYYRIYPTYNVVIYGTIVGEGEGGEVIYSPIDGIEQDFGITLQVTWS
ncbi:hypothetical protein [Thermococcus sp. LS2]|uniref:hypothetical protein n=1 Tax=Thermococcus sp. LS2 TaxID=1638260 RepID=UPI00143A3057|nr:hypothetical protein [Thermococcus sp. LS2]NJE13689.1 hypothetical protein [Thermococcus sp. LS2]